MTSAARSGGSVAGDGLAVTAVAEPGDTRAETIANGRLLDADPIGGFDRLTRLAAVLTAAPSSFLAFVSAQRAVRTSSFGIDDAGAGQELPLSESLCAEVVEVDGPVLVDDVDGHPRSRALPVVAQLGLAAWAGFPVRDARGLALGALCVVDTRRRGWSEHHRDVLETLAQAASGEIGLRLALWEARVAQNASSRRADEADRQAVAAGRAAREFHDRARAAALQAETSEQLAAKAQRLARLAEQHAAEADELAATLRESLLPARLPRFPRLDVAARYRAGSGASVLGDFYDLFPTPSGWGAVVGDVCGKGATAARTTALSRSTVRALGHTDDDPAAVLAALHGVLHVWFDQRPSFVTAVYVSLAPGPGGRGLAAAVASAGHPEAVVLRRTGTVEVLGGGGRALGVGPDPIIATETVVLDHGDRLVLCTDGITEARSPQGEQFETEGIVAALGALDPSVGVDEVADALLGATLAHAVGSATDDTALMILGAAQLASVNDAVRRVREVLAAHGVDDTVQTFDEPVPSAASAAARIGCEVGAIANSLLFSVDGAPLLVLASGAHRVDTGKLARHRGVRREKVRRADAELVLEATGQRAGGVAPVGHPRPLPTLVDTCLAHHDVVWASAGDEHTVFATTAAGLVAMTGGTLLDVG